MSMGEFELQYTYIQSMDMEYDRDIWISHGLTGMKKMQGMCGIMYIALLEVEGVSPRCVHDDDVLTRMQNTIV